MIRHWRSCLPAALVAVLAFATPLPAADLDKVEAALTLLPADTAFYGSMLRNREQLDVVAKSKAWAKLMNLPAAKAARQMIEEKLKNPDPPLAQALEFLKQPDNADLVEMLSDAVSDDIFIYGGAGWVDLIRLLGIVNNANNFGQPAALLKPENREKAQEIQVRILIRTLAANAKLLHMPDTVVGFKIKNAKKAEAQIKRLEDLIEMVIAAAPPPLKDGYKRVKVGDSSVLNLTLDGGLVPWDELHIKDYEEKEGEFDPLLKKLAALKLSISLGVHQGYLVLAIGESAAQLGAIGGKGLRLIGLPEFKTLAKFADRRFTSIGYVGKALVSAGSGSPDDVRSMIGSLGQVIDAADLPKATADKLRGDLKWIAENTKKAVPAEAGASLGFSFLTERGVEGFAYSFGTNALLDISKPLTLLDFLGGKPILFGAARLKGEMGDNKEDEARAMEVLAHVEEAVLSKLEDEQKKKYEEVKKDVLPLLKRLGRITTDDFLPSLDGQLGMVLDAKWTSKQWFKQAPLPALPRALPMLEVGLLLGIADEAKFQKAFVGYRAWFNDAAKLVNKLSDGQVPLLEWRAPTVAKGAAGTLAFYPIPEELGLDPQVVPTAGLSKKVAVLTLSRGHTERLLKPTPMKFDGGPLADLSQPLAAASGVDWPTFVDAIAPWVEFAVQSANVPPFPPGPNGDVIKQVKTVLEVLQVYRGTTSATYAEDGVLVTHTELVLRDLK